MRRIASSPFSRGSPTLRVNMLDLNYNIFIFQFNSKDSLQQKNIQSFE